MDGARIHAENSIRQKNQVYACTRSITLYFRMCVRAYCRNYVWQPDINLMCTFCPALKVEH